MPDLQSSPLAQHLAEIRRQGEERDAERRAAATGYPYLDLRRTPLSIEALKLIPEEKARTARVAAVEVQREKLAVAAEHPASPEMKQVIEELKKKKYEVRVFVASGSGLEEIWRLYRFVPAELKEITGKLEIEKQQFGALLTRLKTFAAVKSEFEKADWKKFSTTALFETVLAGALALSASDVHFEAEEKGTRIRLRLDGLLHDVTSGLPTRNYDNLISRVKLLSGLKINIRGEPQDGRFTIALPTKEVEVRVSIIPSEFGETIVMRLLDPETIRVTLGALGLREDNLVLVERELKKPNGLILNTGPTGSGKTTTLYAFLQKLTNPEMKIITIEDPIEYRIEGVEQTQVDPEVGYSFVNGLRAILRQDPDVILVGEIRDLETAEIAMQASLTGHLVFSTLHTNDAVGAVPRLVDLGVKTPTIGPALSLVIAQRLVRRLCEKCKKELPLPQELKAKFKQFLERLPVRVKRARYKSPKIYGAQGCAACNRFGYQGRTGLFEFLQAGREFEEVILKEPSEVALRKLASRQGMVTMQEDGILKVMQGLTSFEEVEKVTGPIDWSERERVA